MIHFVEDKNLQNSVLSQLKVMGVIVPKMKKLKFRKQRKGKLKVFGEYLSAQERISSSKPPKFILACTEYLQKHSKETWLFRKAGSISRQKNLRVKMENGGTFDGSDPNDVASLLKQWLRELPEPLIPCYLHDSFIRCQDLNTDESIAASLLLCLLLPLDHLQTLKHLMCFLAELATNKDKTNMDVPNLALIMAPNVFVFGNNSIDQFSNSDIKIKQFISIIQVLIVNADKIGEIPPSLSLKNSTVEGKNECEFNSPNEMLESSPSISRKHYLLRSIKKLVKQNTPSVTTSTVAASGSSSTLLRQTLSVNNVERVGLKDATQTKGNTNLFALRKSDDVCKRSFRLLRKKDKRGLKASKDIHPFTQSLESPLLFQIEVDEINMDPSVEVPLPDIEKFWANNHLEDKHSGLGDFEMTTFSTHLNEQSNKIVAFPIPSFPQNLYQFQPKNFHYDLERDYNNKCNTRELQFSPPANECKSSLREVGSEKCTEITNATFICNPEHFMNIRDLHQSKTSECVVSHCRVKSLKMSAEENQNNYLNININSFSRKENISSNQYNHEATVNKIIKSLTKSPVNTDEKSYRITNTEVSMKSVNNGESKVVREGTFIIEPSLNRMSVNQIKRQNINEPKSKRASKSSCIAHESHNKSQKRQCTALNSRSKTHSKNPSAVIKSTEKFLNSRKTNVSENKPSSKKLTLQKTKNSTNVKECPNLINLDDMMQNSNILIDQTISSNLQMEKACSESTLKKESQMQTSLPSCPTKDEFPENTEGVSKNLFETSQMPKRKLSLSRNPASSHSDSKIPRLKNSFEASSANSFSEVTNTRMVSNSKNVVLRGNNTKIPVKHDNSRNNLSTLELSINDSCFQTPKRNVLLSPNSVVWKSGNKYFSASSPEEAVSNKRESIAMILKAHSGHVQAKVHLYDDLIRENVDSSQNVPSHSTPTSQFSRRLSSSQSLKSTPRQRTNIQTGNPKSSKTNLANRSNSVRNEKSLKSYDSPKFIKHMNVLSPIKSRSLKDVTNSSFEFNGSKNSCCNSQIRDDSFSILVEENIQHPIKPSRKHKRNSFSGKTSRKFIKKVSRSESSPGCPRPYRRVACLIRNQNVKSNI